MMSGNESYRSMRPSPSSSFAHCAMLVGMNWPQPIAPGVRALELVDRIGEMRVAEQEQLLQLAAEKSRARRIVERERRQRIEHVVLAGDAAVVGLDADDRDDELGRHAVLACRCARAARGSRDRTRRRRRCACRSGRSAGNPSTAWTRPAGDRIEDALLHVRAIQQRVQRLRALAGACRATSRTSSAWPGWRRPPAAATACAAAQATRKDMNRDAAAEMTTSQGLAGRTSGCT